jgi:hypothetical protein
MVRLSPGPSQPSLAQQWPWHCLFLGVTSRRRLRLKRVSDIHIVWSSTSVPSSTATFLTGSGGRVLYNALLTSELKAIGSHAGLNSVDILTQLDVMA